MTSSGVCATAAHFSQSRYTGKERDAESGNNYFGARYYASSMGRWMSPDFDEDDDDPEPVPYADLEDPQRPYFRKDRDILPDQDPPPPPPPKKPDPEKLPPVEPPSGS
jgi:RHS repeat-associated protein